MADSSNVKGNNVVKLTMFSNGSEMQDNIQILSVDVLKKINKIPLAVIVIKDGDVPEGDFPISNKDDFKPGTEIKIKAGYGQEEEIIFEGIVIKHGIEITGRKSAKLIVECKDKAVKMTIGRKNARYIDSKDSDIITKLTGNYGLSSEIESTKEQYKELVQYYCTDWDFMLSRAKVNGLLVTTEAGKVTVKPPQTSEAAILKVSYGDDLMEFIAEMDTLCQFSSAQEVTWSMTNQAIVEQEGSAPSLNEQGDIPSSDLASVIGLDSYKIQSSVRIDDNDLKAWADAQLLKSGLSRIRGKMKLQGCAKVAAGKIIELAGIGNRFNGNVYVSSVEHSIANGNWTTETEFGLFPDWFIEKEDIVTPPASGFLHGIEGLQIGVVKKLDEYPEGKNKIQVSIPALQAETEGVWARLANFYGSSGIGSFFVPEIGDEVVLGYLNNDPCHPVILGSLYSSENRPPYNLTADNFTKSIVTKSKIKIELDDDKKVVTIETPERNKIVISDDDKYILLSDQNNNIVKLSANGITMESLKDISITSKAKITVDAASGIELNSRADVKVAGLNITNEAKVGFTARGNATSELSASGQTTVKGTIVTIN